MKYVPWADSFSIAEPLNATKNAIITQKKVVLRRVTYFLVGCIQFIAVIALGSLSVSSCCSERSACGKNGTTACKSIHNKKWKGKCKPLEFGPDFSDRTTGLFVHPEGLRTSFEL